MSGLRRGAFSPVNGAHRIFRVLKASERTEDPRIQKRTTTLVSSPSQLLEVVVEGAMRRRRAPLPAGAAGDLNQPTWAMTERASSHEDAAHDEEEEFGLEEDGHDGERPPEGQRSGVSHEDLGGVGVVPEEAHPPPASAAAKTASSPDPGGRGGRGRPRCRPGR
jgi:hypothetical protein